MATVIMGIGISVPKVRLTQTTAYQLTSPLCCDSDEQRRVMEMIYQGSGVLERGTVAMSDPNVTLENSAEFYKPRQNDDERGPTTRARMEKYEDHSLALALYEDPFPLKQAGLVTTDLPESWDFAVANRAFQEAKRIMREEARPDAPPVPEACG